MAEHDGTDEPLPAPGTPQDHAVAAAKVHPKPASRRTLALILAAVGLIVVINTVGNFIGVAVANDHSNSIVKNQAAKSHQRDLERDKIEQQLKQANDRIDALVTQTRTQQLGDDKALCLVLVGSIQQAKAAGMFNPAGIALVKPLLTQLHCVVPPGLLS
jgi:hypothetical protein